MKRPLLTVQSIKFLPVKDKTYEVPDVPGLFLRIHPSGKKVWKMNKSINGKRIVKTLGSYPKEMSLAQARETVRSYVEDPTKTEEYTFGSVFNDWLLIKKDETVSWKDTSSRFERFILPDIGKLLWNELTPVLILKVLKKNTASNKVAKRTAQEISTLEKYAINMGYTDRIRFQYLSKNFPIQRVKHRSCIQPNELTQFFKQLDQVIHRTYRRHNHWYLVQLLFYTLLRISEVSSLKWEYVNQEKQLITIPAEIMKTRVEHTIPITTQIKAILNKLEHVNDYIFQYRKPDNMLLKAKGGELALSSLFREASVNGLVLVPHGVRATGRIWMSENSIPFEVAENCLSHKIGSAITQAYNRTTLLEQRRVAMQKWNDYVEKCLKEAEID